MKLSWLSNQFVGQWVLTRLFHWRLWHGKGLVGLVVLRVDGCYWRGKWDKSFNIVMYKCALKSLSFALYVMSYVSYQSWWKFILMVLIFHTNIHWKHGNLTNCLVYLKFIGLYWNKTSIMFDDSHYSSKLTIHILIVYIKVHLRSLNMCLYALLVLL